MACSPDTAEPVPETGDVRFISAVPQALAGDEVTRVTVTLTAPGVATSTTVLTKSADSWSGTLYQVPAGTQRTFTAEAFAADGSLRYRGVATDVTITAGTTSVVAITLQALNVPGPFDNSAPCIDSLVASASTVLPGGTLSLQATAHDADTSDTFTYAWTATGGTFGSATLATTTWTAPATAGVVTLTLTVTDSRGATAVIRINITVISTDGGPDTGVAQVSVTFNVSPAVNRVTASQSPLPVGQSTTVVADVTDPDGDALTYQWSASCAGTWTDDTTSTASFTPSAVPAGESCGNCSLTVAVKDPNGGQTQGTLRICVGTGPVANVPPRIVLSNQSALSVAGDGTVTFRVLAEDGNGSALTFAWASTHGTLGTATSGFTSSEIAWKAPACIPDGPSPTISATVTNALGFSASTSFSVAVVGVPTCTPPPESTVARWDATAAMTVRRYGASVVPLPSGKILVFGGVTVSNPVLLSGEIYDPATATWAPAASMGTAHYSPAVTRLPSGRLLVTGGFGLYPSTTPLRSVELYDPATNTWTAGPTMAFARGSHTSTLLPNGKVLIIGGNTSGDTASNRIPELFDPATMTFVPVAASAFVHTNHEAVLLPSGKILVLGGNSPAEFYDPATNTWSNATGLIQRNFTHAFLQPSGKVLLAGSTTLIALYDPVLNVQTTVGNFNYDRVSSSIVQLASGKLLLAGGNSLVGLTTEVFDPATGTTSFSISMASNRYSMGTTLLPNGKVLFIGGWDRDAGASVNAVLLYTP
ncbi:Kelch repeat-containing protein [Corallococcus terminator]|uniref:Kelch-like protein n=1 Tax=Corallococcus terminator TaxID=2316733 RepID=A0A3A8J4X4_9BACT|nr:kelch motif-containing protein [Corallococcus terminator]RKG90038.1 kelch-like protein [Corallococcus terminator]